MDTIPCLVYILCKPARIIDSFVHIELAALKKVCKEVGHGVVALFKPIYPVEPPNTMEPCGTLVGEEPGDT